MATENVTSLGFLGSPWKSNCWWQIFWFLFDLCSDLGRFSSPRNESHISTSRSDSTFFRLSNPMNSFLSWWCPLSIPIYNATHQVGSPNPDGTRTIGRFHWCWDLLRPHLHTIVRSYNDKACFSGKRLIKRLAMNHDTVKMSLERDTWLRKFIAREIPRELTIQQDQKLWKWKRSSKPWEHTLKWFRFL
jgi:hypothetical protein